MKKKTFFLLLCCMISLCSSSIAWWSTAHDMIAHIALNKLTPETLKNCDKYLEKLIIYPGCLQASKNTSTFIEASNWCDIIKKYTWKNSENKRVNSLFHHIDIITFPDQKISVKNTIKTINKLLKSNTDEGKYNSYTSLQVLLKLY